MIDLHTHILPGLDDGSPDLETSVLMAAVAAESGVTHLVATPHSNQRGAFENYASPALQVRFDCLCTAVNEAGIPLELSLGMEIFGTGDVLQLLHDGRLLTLGGGRYLLIEFGFHEDPLRIERLLDALLADGYWPVVAHPERYYGLQRMPGAWDYLAERCSEELARCLLEDNPGRILRSEPLPEGRFRPFF